jgi:outer membrane protein assembly factor BamB
MRILWFSWATMLICDVALVAPAQAQVEWNTYRHDNARTGVQSAASNLTDPKRVVTLTVKWSFPGAPAAASGPFVNTFTGHDQQHFAYRDGGQVIWDCFYSSGDNSWHMQQINLDPTNAGRDGPHAIDGPFIDTFAGHDQQHFAYRDSQGAIWDSYYSSSDNSWHLQQINFRSQNPNAMTSGPAAVEGPFINTFAGHDQQHFAYRDNRGAIWDSYYSSGDNSWHLQQINLRSQNAGAVTDGPAAATGPFVDTFSGHGQQHFAYRDSQGAIWDSYYSSSDNSWHLQQINMQSQNQAAMTDGPAAIEGPFINSFAGHDQQHFVYRAQDATVWDSFYESADNRWHLQQINCRLINNTCTSSNPLAVTDGNSAASGAFVDTFAGHDQQHFAYRDPSGAIWDAFYASADNKWHLQQLNCQSTNACPLSNPLAVLDGPAAVDRPFVNTFDGHDQQHFAYRDSQGAIWDAYYWSGDNSWHPQKVNLGGVCGPNAVGAFRGSPIVADDTVFIGSDDGYFYAVDAITGALKWQFPKKSDPPLLGTDPMWRYGIQSSAAIWDNGRQKAVIFGAQDPSLGPVNSGARLFALNAQTGVVIWKSDPVAAVDDDSGCNKKTLHQRIHYSPPLIFNNKAYVGIQSDENPVQVGRVVSVDLSNGHIDQGFQFRAVGTAASPPGTALGGGVWNAPATDGTGIYFTTGNVKTNDSGCSDNPNPSPNNGLSLIRVDKDTGNIVWGFQPVPFELDDDPDWASGATVMSTSCGELITSVQKDGWTYAVTPNSTFVPGGMCLWQFPPVIPPIGSPPACIWTGSAKFSPAARRRLERRAHHPHGWRKSTP